MDFKQIVDAVQSLGVLGLALLVIYAFLKELVVPRGRLDEQRADKAEAVQIARDSIAAQNRLAAAVEERNKLEAAREQAQREARA